MIGVRTEATRFPLTYALPVVLRANQDRNPPPLVNTLTLQNFPLIQGNDLTRRCYGVANKARTSRCARRSRSVGKSPPLRR